MKSVLNHLTISSFGSVLSVHPLMRWNIKGKTALGRIKKACWPPEMLLSE